VLATVTVRYANKKLYNKSSISPLLRSDGSYTGDPSVKSELLQEAFAKNYTFDNDVLLLWDCSIMPKTPNCKLTHAYFSSTMVRPAIKKLRLKIKGGPDDIPPSFFINCREKLCYPLSQFFTVSFEHGIIWSSTFITPLFKKGITADANNYRPIALTCTMCELMESIIKDKILKFLMSKKPISMYAFIKQHSTLTNSLQCMQDWLLSLNSHLSIDAVYIDFSRAFDSIVISKLLFKLECYGVSGLLREWISCFFVW
jgi:Reverse transcriptase (RNA-dependent DNA polymerase)